MLAVELASIGEQLLPWLKTVFGEHSSTALQVLQIIGIDILLSGDNAVVIALACRSLPPEKRMAGIVLGVAAAIVLRVAFTIGLQHVIEWPWLTLAGGLLLLWIAIQLLIEAEHDDKMIADSKSLFGAIRTIALADLVMSLDNVLAIAGAAHGKPHLILFGLALSIPLIMGGATLIINLLTRFPVLVWAGAALLGWIAGELIATERNLKGVYDTWAVTVGLSPAQVPHAGAIAGAVLVLAIGAIVQARRKAVAAKVPARP